MRSINYRGVVIGGPNSPYQITGVEGLDDFESDAASPGVNWIHGGYPAGGFAAARELTVSFRTKDRTNTGLSTDARVRELKRAFAPDGLNEYKATITFLDGTQVVGDSRCVSRSIPITLETLTFREGSVRMLFSDPRLYSVNEFGATYTLFQGTADGASWTDMVWGSAWPGASIGERDLEVNNNGTFSTWPTIVVTNEIQPLNPNPGFESSINGWESAFLSHSTKHSRNGEGAGLVTADGVTGNVQAWVNYDNSPLVTPGLSYSAQAWSYSEVGQPQTSILISWRDADNVQISAPQSTEITSVAGTWTKHELTSVAPAGAVKGRLFLRMAGTPANGTQLWWDDAKLYRSIGNITSPKIYNLDTGETLDFSNDGGLSLPIGEKLTVTTSPFKRNIQLSDGTARWNNLKVGSRFFPLRPGTNRLRLTVEGTSEGTGLMVRWRHAEV